MVAAGASDLDDFVFWMDAGFHGNLDVSVAAESTGTEVRVATPKIPLVFRRVAKSEHLKPGRSLYRTGPVTTISLT
jgi:hypothetical protein